MRRRPAFTFAFALLAAGSVAVAPPAAAQDVGTMVEVINTVNGTPAGGSPSAMAVGDGVEIEMRIETGRASFAKMTFLEGGSLDVGAEAELVIDRATVDAATGASDSLLSVLVGKIRLALSSAFSGDVEIDTPTATIGVKGTILAVEPDRTGDNTTVWVEEGVVEVTSKAGGTVEVSAGYLTTVRRGAPPTDPAPFDPESGAAAARALPPEFTPPSEDVFDDSPTTPEGQDLPPRRDDNPNDPSNVPPQGSANRPPTSSSGPQ